MTSRFDGFAVTDFNADDRLDLVLASGIGLDLFLQSAGGVLSPYLRFPLCLGILGSHLFVGAADLNDDLAMDFVIYPDAYPDNPGMGDVLSSDGQGGFNRLSFPLTPGRAMALTDLNRDGSPDLVVASDPNITGSADPELKVLLSHRDGTFASPVSYPLAPTLLADLNGDGAPDVVAVAADDNVPDGWKVTVWLNSGAGAFASKKDHVLHDPAGIPIGAVSAVTADFNGDLRPDLAMVAKRADGGVAVSVVMNGGSAFATVASYPVQGAPGYSTLAAGDLNGDGKIDLALVAYPLNVLLNRGDGTFGAMATAGDTPCPAPRSSFVLADVNGDGKDDFVFTSRFPGFLGGQYAFEAMLSTSP